MTKDYASPTAGRSLRLRIESKDRFRPIADMGIKGDDGEMRTAVPEAFRMTFMGPEGEYVVAFRPTDECDGLIDVAIAGVGMRWDVVDASKEDGAVVLGGMTTGSEALWNDQFWFELRFEDTIPTIRYWGNKVIWREDRSLPA